MEPLPLFPFREISSVRVDTMKQSGVEVDSFPGVGGEIGPCTRAEDPGPVLLEGDGVETGAGTQDEEELRVGSLTNESDYSLIVCVITGHGGRVISEFIWQSVNSSLL